MKFKKLLSMTLAIAMVMTTPAMAMEEPIVEEVIQDSNVDIEVLEADGIDIDVSDITVVPDSVEEEIGSEPVDVSVLSEELDSAGVDVDAAFVIEEKCKLNNHDVVNTLDTLTEGEDYQSDTIIKWTDDAALVQFIADKYDADIVRFDNHVAVFKLRSMGVRQALALAADPNNDYPAIDPNYIYRIEPEMEMAVENGFTPSLDAKTPTFYGDWSSFIATQTNADPSLTNPSDEEYQWHHDMIHSYAAWGVTKGSPDCKVAVIDTGLDNRNVDFIQKSGSEGSWRSLYYDGSNWVDMPSDTIPIGEESHGSHVAGLISARQNNGEFGSGVAPYTTIWGFNTCNADGGLNDDYILSAIYEATDMGAWIINMSLGSPIYTLAEEEACLYAKDNGVAVFVSIGNDGSNIKKYPAAYDSTIAVRACNKAGKLAGFSTYGSWADLTAPGVDIYSTGFAYDVSNTPAIENMSGTSQATPIAAGVAALYLSALYEQSGKTDGLSPVDPDKLLVAMQKSTTNGVIDAAKLLNVKMDAPVITVYDKNNNRIAGNNITVKETGYVEIVASTGGSQKIKYTVDGSTPSLTNGAEVVGDYLRINLDNFFDPGNTVTIKAIAVNRMEVVSGVGAIKIKIAADDEITPPMGVNPVSTIDIPDASNIVLRVYDPLYYPSESKTIVPVFKDASGVEIDKSQVSYKFTTSNRNIAAVDSYGMITATGVGTAKITCKALDGSGKYKTISVKVIAGIDDVSINGQESIAPGAKATYTAKVSGLGSVSVTSKRWSLDTPVEGVTIDERKGIVKVAPYVPVGTTIDIKVEVSDGSITVSPIRTIQVQPKASKVAIDVLSGYETSYGGLEPINPKYKKGVLQSINLYSKKIKNSGGVFYDTNVVQLQSTVIGNNIPVVWKSSNPSVAQVDNYGEVTAFKAGKVKITCSAQDGSKKSASVTVNVINPASSVKLTTNNNFIDKDHMNYNFIPIGKSIQINPAYGDAYGKVSVKKVSWDYEVIRDSDVSTVLKNKLDAKHAVKISSKGKVSLSSKAKSILESGDLIRVIATTADGTQNQAIYDLVVNTRPANKLYFSTNHGFKSKAVYVNSGLSYLPKNSYAYIPVYSGYKGYYDATYYVFSVKSSNPDIVGGQIDSAGTLFIMGGQKSGTATITLKSADGGKGVAKLKVTVR